MATIGLALSVLVVADRRLGRRRACRCADNVIDNEGGLFAMALVLGLLFIGMGGLTALSLPRPRHKKTH